MSWSERRVDEASLVGVRQRSGQTPPVVLLHGFTQTGRSWEPVIERLDPRTEIFAPDAPGHGTSTESRLGIAEYADALATSLPPAVYVGYSMGGRTALHVALRHPRAVLALVLVGATAGLDDETERQERRRRDDELASRLETLDLDQFLTEWLSQPLFDSLPRKLWNLDDRRRNTTAGLARSLRTAGTGVQRSLWSRLREIECATTLVTGAEDRKFSLHAERMASLLGGSVNRVEVPGRGHAVHLEDPDAVAAIIDRTRSSV